MAEGEAEQPSTSDCKIFSKFVHRAELGTGIAPVSSVVMSVRIVLGIRGV